MLINYQDQRRRGVCVLWMLLIFLIFYFLYIFDLLFKASRNNRFIFIYYDCKTYLLFLTTCHSNVIHFYQVDTYSSKNQIKSSINKSICTCKYSISKKNHNVITEKETDFQTVFGWWHVHVFQISLLWVNEGWAYLLSLSALPLLYRKGASAHIQLGELE